MVVEESLKYPIGPFVYKPNEEIQLHIDRIKGLPEQLSAKVVGLGEKELNWRYRPEGWKLFQVVHHIADSHINAYTRMKVACTENGKAITPYDENAWSKLADVNSTDLQDSLAIIFLIHKKMVTFLEARSADQWSNGYYHPADQLVVSLREAVQIYAWHGEHHLAHIEQGLASAGSY